MNKSIAFYLKYRPQTLDDLIGQENIKKVLTSSFTQNRLSHAYLFVGPRGTGKTSTARILAKMVKCLDEAIKPCNKCSNCLTITDGSNLDLIEIDAASNRGIEDIRALREKIKLSPTSSQKKVYIIDEVHMLTTEAFNALLKTLEEPPAHALFILATTEVQKVPQTILSRVQRLDFKLASQDELTKALQKIITSEKINIDEDALKLLVKKAEGSFRDGVKYLDQISLTSEKITLNDLEKSLNTSKFELILEILKSLGKLDTTTSLALVVKATTDGGIDSKELILSLMDIFRQIVFIKNGLGDQLVKPNYLEDLYKELVSISEGFKNQTLVSNLDILQKALEKMKTSSIPSLPLELSVVEMCEELVQPAGQVKVIERIVEKQVEKATEPQVQREEMVLVQESVESSIPMHSLDLSPDILKLKEKWGLVLETVRPFNFSLEALLRSTNISECTENKVLLEVPYSFHQRILEAPKNRDLLESVLSDILGRSVQVATILGARSPRREDIANIEVAADDEIIRAAAEIFSSDTIN